jgi:glycosyltransferase involved in cell wall biosynthesis
VTRSGPTVTALIPTRRRPELLRRAIESVLAQTYPNVRVFVCDNASGDATEDVVRELAARDARVAYHKHPVDIGAYPNFQYGLDSVTTEMFSFLSDDDLLFPEFYERAVQSLERDPGAGFYASQTVLYDVSRGTHRLRPARHWSPGRHEAGQSARLMLEHPFVWTGCVFRTSVRDAVGALVPVPMGDVLFTVKAASAFPFVADLRVGALFSETDSNFSRGLAIDTLRRSSEVARHWAAGLKGLSDSDREEMVRIVDALMIDMARRILREAIEARDFPRFMEVADCLHERGRLSGSRRAKLALGRSGAWGFRALSAWTRLQSGTKRRRTSGWKTMSVDDVLAKYR